MAVGMPPLSVCICSHNPNSRDFEQTLTALNKQTLGPESWELLVVDNASQPSLASKIQELANGLPTRIVTEERLGLTHARIRAIFEARGEVLVFVDDDNVLEPDYLAHVIDIFSRFPRMGAIGGQITGRFEVEPPAWLRPFLRYYAVGGAGSEPIIGHKGQPYGPWFPRGAGMAVRADAAREWADQLAADSMRQRLGRIGGALGGGEDIDLVMTILNLGLGAGYFPQLKLTHLIPPKRLKLGYAARLIYQTHLSCDRMEFLQGTRHKPRPWPVEHLFSMAAFMRAGAWHPLGWYLAMQLSRGRYAAWRSIIRPEK